MLILNYLGQGAWLLNNHGNGFHGNQSFSECYHYLIIPSVIWQPQRHYCFLATDYRFVYYFSEAMSLNFGHSSRSTSLWFKRSRYIPRFHFYFIFMSIVVIYFKESVHGSSVCHSLR